jgi:uncharacterized repeat protein (TIGR04076 family)
VSWPKTLIRQAARGCDGLLATASGSRDAIHPVGAYFEVSGENLSLPPGQTFPFYPLAGSLPLIPAKQRITHKNDWISTDMDVACPDPHCGGIFRIKRLRKRVFRHCDASAVPIDRQEE